MCSTQGKPASMFVCTVCFQLTEKRCQCRRSSYCSVVCQKKDWKEHKKHCILKRDKQYIKLQRFVRSVETELSNQKKFTKWLSTVYWKHQSLHLERLSMFWIVCGGIFPKKEEMQQVIPFALGKAISFLKKSNLRRARQNLLSLSASKLILVLKMEECSVLPSFATYCMGAQVEEFLPRPQFVISIGREKKEEATNQVAKEVVDTLLSEKEAAGDCDDFQKTISVGFVQIKKSS